jgi:hypothetical protein
MPGAAVREGVGDICPAQQGVDVLSKISVQDVGHTATGAAVADDVLVVMIVRVSVGSDGAVYKHHRPHSLPGALGYDPLGFLLADRAILVGEGTGPSLDTGANDNVGLQGVVAAAVGRTAAAGTYRDGTV